MRVYKLRVTFKHSKGKFSLLIEWYYVAPAPWKGELAVPPFPRG